MFGKLTLIAEGVREARRAYFYGKILIITVECCLYPLADSSAAFYGYPRETVELNHDVISRAYAQRDYKLLSSIQHLIKLLLYYFFCYTLHLLSLFCAMPPIGVSRKLPGP